MFKKGEWLSGSWRIHRQKRTLTHPKMSSSTVRANLDLYYKVPYKKGQ